MLYMTVFINYSFFLFSSSRARQETFFFNFFSSIKLKEESCALRSPLLFASLPGRSSFFLFLLSLRMFYRKQIWKEAFPEPSTSIIM